MACRHSAAGCVHNNVKSFRCGTNVSEHLLVREHVHCGAAVQWDPVKGDIAMAVVLGALVEKGANGRTEFMGCWCCSWRIRRKCRLAGFVVVAKIVHFSAFWRILDRKIVHFSAFVWVNTQFMHFSAFEECANVLTEGCECSRTEEWELLLSKQGVDFAAAGVERREIGDSDDVELA